MQHLTMIGLRVGGSALDWASKDYVTFLAVGTGLTQLSLTLENKRCPLSQILTRFQGYIKLLLEIPQQSRVVVAILLIHKYIADASIISYFGGSVSWRMDKESGLVSCGGHSLVKNQPPHRQLR